MYDLRLSHNSYSCLVGDLPDNAFSSLPCAAVHDWLTMLTDLFYIRYRLCVAVDYHGILSPLLSLPRTTQHYFVLQLPCKTFSFE